MNESQIESPCGVVASKSHSEKFGLLTLLRLVDESGWSPKWECLCDCGTVTIVAMANLRRKTRPTESCGCVGKERARAVNVQRLTSHGKRFTRTYRCWANMKTRATNPKSTHADRYVLRGITICDRWLNFESFLEDMGECPTDLHSIDRFPNNDGNYEPGNCRWATAEEQQRNKCDNHMVTFQGVTMCLTEMCEKHGIRSSVALDRINRYGWSVERTFSTPVRQN